MIHRKHLHLCICAIALTCMFACGAGKQNNTVHHAQTVERADVPAFNTDSALLYTQAQVNFGPRVPNTASHKACADFLAKKLESFGAVVTVQQTEQAAYDGTLLSIQNIIGSFKPDIKKRIALFAHWDTRPWADNDAQTKNHHTPIDGANDGASGVGVLLEIARLIGMNQPALGIDIILFDAEDYGAPQFYQGTHKEEHWCIGSQYWSYHAKANGYNARFGILLDMVGGKESVFLKEGYSNRYAGHVNNKVWKAARELGYEMIFQKGEGGFVTDDHLFVNRITQIPTIDIIPFSERYSFTPTWHTVNDNMANIDPNILHAVGQTVMEVIYNEH